MKNFFTSLISYIITIALFAGDYFLQHPGFMFIYGTICFFVALFLFVVSASIAAFGLSVKRDEKFNHSISSSLAIMNTKSVLIKSVIFWVIILGYLIFVSPHFVVATMAIISIIAQITVYLLLRFVKYANDPLQKDF